MFFVFPKAIVSVFDKLSLYYLFIYFYNLNTKNINKGMHCLFLTVRRQQSLSNQLV